MSNITLKGSLDIISDFFKFAINSILYQRSLYPAEDFSFIKKYNLNLLFNPQLTDYLDQITDQLKVWVSKNKVSKLVLVISNNDLVLERWQFSLQVQENSIQKMESKVDQEIAAIIKQITASNTFLPILDEPENATFNILAYTDRDAPVPSTWIDSDAKIISKNVNYVKLRNFNTGYHKVEAMVAYKLQD